MPRPVAPAFLEIPQNRRLLAAELRADALREQAEQQLPGLQTDPLSLVTSGKLQIKDKAGQQRPLILKAPQRLLFQKIQALRLQKRPVRIWVLKYRQGGISTLSEAVLYALTSLQPNRNALVMADEKEKAKYIHDMSKFYHEQMTRTDAAITPGIKQSNERMLEFETIHSRLIIVTAENVDAPRAMTYQYVHLSEFAFYRDLSAIMQALQGVPDHADTLIIGETTANGAGTDAHQRWLDAKRGASDWVPLFLPWYLDEDYERPAPEYPTSSITFDGDDGLEGFLREEEELHQQILADPLMTGVTEDAIARKLNWRRATIVNKCDGKVATFRVEYPADDAEAWAVSGQLYYPRQWTKKQVVKTPLRVGSLVPGIERPEIRDLVDGPIQFFEWPTRHDEYLIVGDPSEGMGGDNAACVVRRRRDNVTVAELSSERMDTDHLAAQMFLLAQLYGEITRSLLIPERNGVGVALVTALRKLCGNLWRERVTEAGGAPTEREGWWTDAISRPLMFQQLGFELRDGSVTLSGRRSIQEVSQLINTDGKAEAPPQGQDGLAICHAIASKARSLRPPSIKAAPNFPSAREAAAKKLPPMNMGRGWKT